MGLGGIEGLLAWFSSKVHHFILPGLDPAFPHPRLQVYLLHPLLGHLLVHPLTQGTGPAVLLVAAATGWSLCLPDHRHSSNIHLIVIMSVLAPFVHQADSF